MASRNHRKKNDHSEKAHEGPKRSADKMWGNVCIFYLLLMLAILSWELFDTWINQYFLLKKIGYGLQSQQTLKLIGFTVIAGALGGVVNGLRSSLQYHSRFDRQHTWKYLCAPWMGATLALFVYALLRSSVSALGGGASANVSNTQVLSNFAIGALVGYGSKDVFVWLDSKVTKLFYVTVAPKTVKPKKSRSAAKKRKRNDALNLNVSREPLPRNKSIPVTMSADGKVN